VLDAAGFDVVLVETVGAGQAEVDIARLAHTTVVVEAPGFGDDIQAIKAGILEIADVLVVNKADLPGVENTERALRGSLDLAHPAPRRVMHHGKVETLAGQEEASTQALTPWAPPILRTVATEGQGIAEVVEAIASHRVHLQISGGWEQKERWRLQTELDLLVASSLVSRFRQGLEPGAYDRVLGKMLKRQLSPLQAVDELAGLSGMSL
jgi:LAO/AO transport system kinase